MTLKPFGVRLEGFQPCTAEPIQRSASPFNVAFIESIHRLVVLIDGLLQVSQELSMRGVRSELWSELVGERLA